MPPADVDTSEVPKIELYQCPTIDCRDALLELYDQNLMNTHAGTPKPRQRAGFRINVDRRLALFSSETLDISSLLLSTLQET